MWRSSKKLIADCFRFLMQCGANNLDTEDLDDVPEYDIPDVPVHFAPRAFVSPVPPRQEDLQHRPCAPGSRRRSPPEVVLKVRLALEEMTNKPIEKARGDHRDPHIFEPRLTLSSTINDTS
ncbi:uncharacterized protein LOC111674315 [Orussus abietinus]|uniref:uncharacterized protein LOC111674315 n=1 Tax=Orussus abietinus TaxID=222816 RepID=UPI000C7161D4|nr:uncharacterized protein LOC111674315 [Orussus abietinus]